MHINVCQREMAFNNHLEDSALEIIWLVVVVQRNTFAGMDLLQGHH